MTRYRLTQDMFNFNAGHEFLLSHNDKTMDVNYFLDSVIHPSIRINVPAKIFKDYFEKVEEPKFEVVTDFSIRDKQCIQIILDCTETQAPAIAEAIRALLSFVHYSVPNTKTLEQADEVLLRAALEARKVLQK